MKKRFLKEVSGINQKKDYELVLSVNFIKNK